jgi:hypothetical protein
MDDQTRENTNPGDAATPHRHHHHHHHRHHHRGVGNGSQEGSHHIHIEDIPRRKQQHRAESLFVRNFLKIAGFFFLAAALWFGFASVIGFGSLATLAGNAGERLSIFKDAFSLLFHPIPIGLFLAIFTGLLLLFSWWTKNQPALFTGLGMLFLLLLFVSLYWIFRLVPSVFVKSIVYDGTIFYKGLFLTLSVTILVFLFYRQLRHAEITAPKKVFDRSVYRRLLKGILLYCLYLLAYWIFNFFFYLGFGDSEAKYMIWFSFNCLYFAVAIIVLGRMHSSYLRGILVLAVFLNLVYPVFINPDVIGLRDGFLKDRPDMTGFFVFHYLSVGLLALLLGVMYKYMRRVFAGKKIVIRGFYFYFSLFVMFLVFTEFDHLTVILGYHHGVPIQETLAHNREVPYSLLLLGSSLVILTIGIIRKSRFLRILALALITLTLIKILAYDFSSMTRTGKTVLFLFVGVLLLFISFFYSTVRRYFFRKEHVHHHHTSRKQKDKNEAEV